MIEPTEADIGRAVVYRERHKGGRVELGVVTSFNDVCVFVRYAGAGSVATRREDLQWSEPVAEVPAGR